MFKHRGKRFINIPASEQTCKHLREAQYFEHASVSNNIQVLLTNDWMHVTALICDCLPASQVTWDQVECDGPVDYSWYLTDDFRPADI